MQTRSAWRTIESGVLEGSARVQWESAVALPLELPRSRLGDVTLAVEITVYEGVAAVGVHAAEEVLSELMVEAHAAPRTVFIPFYADGTEQHHLVVRNGSHGALRVAVWSLRIAGFVESLERVAWRRSLRSCPPGMVYDAFYEGTTAEWLAEAELSGRYRDPARRLARLRRIVDLAYRACPGYREHWDEAGWHPSDLRTLEDANSIPPISKAVIRRDVSSFTVPRRRLLPHTTSGSTGEPFTFFYTRASEAAHTASASLLLRAPRRAIVMGLQSSSAPSLLKVGHGGTLRAPSRLLGDKALFARVINVLKPDILYGWPSLVSPAIDIVRAHTDHRFLRVALASEGALPGQLAMISEVADSVGMVYGTAEGVGFAERCPECGHYVERIAFGVTTLRPRLDGTLDLMGTSFSALGTLFIGYETGDLATPATSESCACSSSGAVRFSGVAGRVQDTLPAPTRDVAVGPIFATLDVRLPGWGDVELFDFQCSRSAVGTVTLRYQTTSGRKIDEDAALRLLRLGAHDIDFEIRRCPDLSAERDRAYGRKWQIVKRI